MYKCRRVKPKSTKCVERMYESWEEHRTIFLITVAVFGTNLQYLRTVSGTLSIAERAINCVWGVQIFRVLLWDHPDQQKVNNNCRSEVEIEHQDKSGRSRRQEEPEQLSSSSAVHC